MCFMREDEALKTMTLFGAAESGKVSRMCLKNWVVNAFRERRHLALTLNDTKTAVNKLHQMANVLVGIIVISIWLIILNIADSHFFVVIGSQLLLAVFMFGNTLKMIFEAMIFLFVMHPFDVGDRCEIDGVQMIVEEMNILTTIFLRYDNLKFTIPNTVLAALHIANYYRSPDMGESIDFCIHVSTPREKIDLMKQRIIRTMILEAMQVTGNLARVPGYEIEEFDAASSCLLLFVIARVQERMGSLKIFGLPASTDVSRVLTCLFEKDVEFQLIRTDTYKKDHKVPEFLRLQDPSGQVTMKDGLMTLVDSREICRHIAEKYPDKGNKALFGTGTLERASIEQWLQSEARNFDPPSKNLVFHLAFAEAMGIIPDEDQIERNVKKLSNILDVYNKRLEASRFLAGDVFTLADLSHLPNAHYLVERSERGRKLFLSRENVARWWQTISSRASWRQVVNMHSEHPGPLEKFTTID